MCANKSAQRNLLLAIMASRDLLGFLNLITCSQNQFPRLATSGLGMARMKSILALDMGSTCGWAFQSALLGFVTSGVTPFLGTLNPGSRWVRFASFLDEWYAIARPYLIVYEEPIVVFKRKQGLGIGFGIESVLRLFCVQHEIHCEGVN